MTYYLTKHPLVQRLNTPDARRERARTYLASRPWVKPVVIGAGVGSGHCFARSVSAVNEWPERPAGWRDVAMFVGWIAFSLFALWAMSAIRGS